MIKTIQEMMTIDGIITRSNIVSIYGMSQSGKTTLALEILWEESHRTKRPALIYDTEGGVYDTLLAWTPTFAKKWPNGMIHTRGMRDIRDILNDHGVEVSIEFDNKISIRCNKMVDMSDMMKLCQSKKYSMICYDSYTAPFKLFGVEFQNFAARSAANWYWNRKIFDIQDKFKIPILQIHHGTRKPNDKSIIDKMAGGQSVQYPCKYLFNVQRPIINKPTRYIYTLRHPKYAPFTQNWRINLTPSGYADAGNIMVADKDGVWQ